MRSALQIQLVTATWAGGCFAVGYSNPNVREHKPSGSLPSLEIGCCVSLKSYSPIQHLDLTGCRKVGQQSNKT